MDYSDGRLVELWYKDIGLPGPVTWDIFNSPHHLTNPTFSLPTPIFKLQTLNLETVLTMSAYNNNDTYGTSGTTGGLGVSPMQAIDPSSATDQCYSPTPLEPTPMAPRPVARILTVPVPTTTPPALTSRTCWYVHPMAEKVSRSQND